MKNNEHEVVNDTIQKASLLDFSSQKIANYKIDQVCSDNISQEFDLSESIVINNGFRFDNRDVIQISLQGCDDRKKETTIDNILSIPLDKKIYDKSISKNLYELETDNPISVPTKTNVSHDKN